ncbi:Protein CBG26357 [Caenorhabditis briggsae]|uniref:Protein CBG26357 n=1 Tax=Caenorhabditis briggsae TaxID=6238 RepID=B6IGC8_CAEBR|nr:Protein CBG26357 [Caenorhabditis briggsae]CAR98958.1 Protein CBG26357 [Caenorhabditis briggsae]
MGDDSSQDNTGSPPATGAAAPAVAQAAGNAQQQQPASAIRNKVDVPPGFGRRVSSVEVVKNAMPPTKKASVVIFETPDTPKAERRASSWWRNLVMDDDKTAAAQQPEIVLTPDNAGNGLEDRHRNISTASVGDSEFCLNAKEKSNLVH